MKDFIDHLLSHSFRAVGTENELQPRTPGLFEEWRGDVFPVEEEATPELDSIGPPAQAPAPDIPPVVHPFLDASRQRGILLPQEGQRISDDGEFRRETARPLPEATAPPAANKPVLPRTPPSEHEPQTEPASSEKTVRETVHLTTTEMGNTPPVPPTPPDQPQPARQAGPEPVQPAPVRLETVEQTVVQQPGTTTNIRIHIGRIEVQLPQSGRPPAPAPTPPARPRAPFRPPMTLRDYMDNRRR